MFRFLLYFSLLSPFLGLTQQQIKGVFSPKDSFKVVMLYQLQRKSIVTLLPTIDYCGTK